MSKLELFLVKQFNDIQNVFMHCLIFGGNGQLGREFDSFLERKGVERKTYSSSEVDITESNRVRQAVESFRPDVVINCAAYTKVDQSEQERLLAKRVNTDGAGIVAHVCAEQNAKMVHFSTDYVFPGNREDRKLMPDGYPEDHPTFPVNWYGETKLAGEKVIRQSGTSYIIVRTSWVCGLYGSNFVKTMLRLADERESIDVVNDQWGSPSYAENIVMNTMNLVDKDKEGIYNITSEGLITWYDFAHEIFRLSGKEIKLNSVSSEQFSMAAKRPVFSKLDIVKLKSVEGSEIWSWKEGLKRLMAQLAKSNNV